MITNDFFALIIPAFIAGLFTFLAPCTFPLVPAYLGFISGTSHEDLSDPGKAKLARRKMLKNGIFFMIGVTIVFVTFGAFAGFLGQALTPWRLWLTRIGGVFVILFGLIMIGLFRIPFFSSLFEKQRSVRLPFSAQQGSSWGSMVLGASFALGWTPCVGPVLGSILLLASTSSTILQGAFLLFIFSLGLAVPFLVIAAGFGIISSRISVVYSKLRVVQVIGGIFLLILGILLASGKFGLLVSYGFELLDFLNYDAIYKFL
jgi:cytochrome c-type biogenesis protein